MSQTALIYLHVTATLQLIIVSNAVLHMNLISIHNFNFHRLCVRLMPFAKETASLHVKPAKHKLHLSAQSSLTSETRHFDVLTHNVYFCAYSGLQNTTKIY